MASRTRHMHVDAHHENNNQDTVMDVQAKEFTKREETPEITTPPFSRTDFLKSLNPNRNFYFISRQRPLEHHIRAVVTLKNGKPTFFHFAGTNVEQLIMCSSDLMDDEPHSSDPLEKSERATAGEIMDFLNEATRQLRVLYPQEQNEVQCQYEGQYRAVTVTEFIVQDSNTDEGSFVDGIRREIQSQLHRCIEKEGRNFQDRDNNQHFDLEMMDLQCMLSCLPQEELSSSSLLMRDEPHPTSNCREIMNRAVTTIHLSLFLDAQNRILNTEYWKPDQLVASYTRIEELNPKEDAIWLEYTPQYPGYMQMANVTCPGDLEPIIHSCIQALAMVERNEYQSPIPFLNFLGSDARLPLNYRQKKKLSIHYDVFRGDIFQCKRKCSVVLDMHTAYTEGIDRCMVILPLCHVSIQVQLSLRSQEELSSLTLTAIDSQSQEELQSEKANFQANVVEMNHGIHVSRMNVVEGEVLLKVNLPSMEGTVIRVSNGAFRIS